MTQYKITTGWVACLVSFSLTAKIVEMPKEIPFATKEKRAATPTTTIASELKTHRFSGQITAPRTSDLSFQQAGHIQLLQQPGTEIKKGAVLAHLDEFDSKQGVRLAQAKKKLADIQLENAKREYEREVQLREAQASTDMIFDIKKAAYEQAKVGIEVATVELQMAKERLNRTYLFAPYDCAIGKKLKNEFEYINIGIGVLTIYEIGRLEVHFQVPESFLGQMHLNDHVQVTVPAVAFQGDALVIRLVGVVDEHTRTFEVVGQLTAPTTQVVPGLFAQAQLFDSTPRSENTK